MKFTLKPIYDIPGFPSVLACDLVDGLMDQIAPFKPTFTLGERAETIEKLEDGRFKVTTHKGTEHTAVVAIAGGLGSFGHENHLSVILQNLKTRVEYIIRP